MDYKELTPEEIYVIEKKVQKDHILGNIMIFIKKVYIDVKSVMHLYINQTQNSNQSVAGQVLMTK